jgi:hypothetical protein
MQKEKKNRTRASRSDMERHNAILDRLVISRFIAHEAKQSQKLLLATATCLAFVGTANACGTTTRTRICYLRNHDRTHLAQHPDQSVTAMRIFLSSEEGWLSSEGDDRYYFYLSVSFRKDKDKWSWGTEGICERFGPGMTCSTLKGGCDTATTNNDFYIDDKPKSIYLYPKHIIFNWGIGERTLTKGKDDEVFRLDKTVC